MAYDRTVSGNRDVWILDLLRDARSPLTRDPAVDGFPVWSPDGARIAFESQRKGTFDIWVKPANGAAVEEILLETPRNDWPLDWSKDGRFLLYRSSDQNYASSDLWALPMTSGNREPISIANSPFEERNGVFSPDGQWVAYETEEFGRAQVVAHSFPSSSGLVHISANEGVAPRWSNDGSEIYFIAPDGKMMAVAVTPSGKSLLAGKPAPLFSTHIVPQPFKSQYDISRGGKFLVHNRRVEETSASPITLILNWRPPVK